MICVPYPLFAILKNDPLRSLKLFSRLLRTKHEMVHTQELNWKMICIDTVIKMYTLCISKLKNSYFLSGILAKW